MAMKKKDYREIVDGILKDLEERSPLTDMNIGSVTRTLVESIGREIFIMYEQMEAAYNAGFIDTARGPALDMVVGILGVQRKTAQFATGSVTFSRRNANHKVTVPRGTRVSTISSDPSRVKVFETTITTTLPRGTNEMEIPVKAVTPGKEGMADFETISKLESPMIGIDRILNKLPTSIGTERETDEELRARAKAVVLSAGKTTTESIRNAVMSIPGVRDVMVMDMPEGVPGEIDVIVDGPHLDDVEGAAFGTVRERIEKVRPAGIKVNIRATTQARTDIIIFLNLTDIHRTDEEMDQALDSIRDNVSDHLASLTSGDNIVRNKLVTTIFRDENVDNLHDILIATKVFDPEVRGLLDDTRKRTDERSRDIVVDRYERVQLEHLEIRTQFTPLLISYVLVDLNVRFIPTRKTVSEPRIMEAIEKQVQGHFERLRGGEVVDYGRILNIVKNVKDISEVTDLTLTALHEESGSITSDAREDIPTGNNEVVKLRKVLLELAG